MKEDSVVAEIRKYRQEFAAEHGDNLYRIFEAIRERQAKSSREVVKRNPRRLLTRTGS
jgi:predicted RNA-binding protein